MALVVLPLPRGPLLQDWGLVERHFSLATSWVPSAETSMPSLRYCAQAAFGPAHFRLLQALAGQGLWRAADNRQGIAIATGRGRHDLARQHALCGQRKRRKNANANMTRCHIRVTFSGEE
jgi:hypothetical protein